MSDQTRFDRPEDQAYLDWLDSLPECTTCEGCGWVHGEFDGEEPTCGNCNGSGKQFPEQDDDGPDDADKFEHRCGKF